MAPRHELSYFCANWRRHGVFLLRVWRENMAASRSIAYDSSHLAHHENNLELAENIREFLAAGMLKLDVRRACQADGNLEIVREAKGITK